MKENQAAAKLERFAHNPGQTCTKGGQQNLQAQPKAHAGAVAVRKSQGQATAAPEVNLTGLKSAGEDIQDIQDTPEPPSGAGALTEREPSLKEILQAIPVGLP